MFLLEQAGSPFGAAEYIGDLSANDEGNAHAEFHLIVQEAFASTLVNGTRTRVDLNRVGIVVRRSQGRRLLPRPE